MATPATGTPMTAATLGDITDAQREALASRRIFFGHQSVGRNILSGLRRILADHKEIRLRIIKEEDPHSVDGPALMEADIGQNGLPGTKEDAFARVLAGGFGSEPGAVAMFKYCYLDMRPDSDPNELFHEYAELMDQLHVRYPRLSLIHITMPLQTAPHGLKEAVKNALGLPSMTQRNRQRQQFNELLLDRYSRREPVFDLAGVESTRSDGSKAFSRYRGRHVYMLAREWTSDGGHLNEKGQDRVAAALVKFLATLEVVSDRAAPSGSKSTNNSTAQSAARE